VTRRHLIFIVFCSIVILFYYFSNLNDILTFETAKNSQYALQEWHKEAPIFSLVIAFIGFTAYAALPMPGLIVLTLLSAAVFGFLPALLITSFGSAIGGTIACLLARYTLRDILQTKYTRQFELVNQGINREGGYYLFSIRLVPIFPFFLVNTLMGLTQLNIRDFYLATQLGMIASSIVFTNAGLQLSQIESVDSLFTPKLVASFLLMAITPLVLKFLLSKHTQSSSSD